MPFLLKFMTGPIFSTQVSGRSNLMKFIGAAALAKKSNLWQKRQQTTVFTLRPGSTAEGIIEKWCHLRPSSFCGAMFYYWVNWIMLNLSPPPLEDFPYFGGENFKFAPLEAHALGTHFRPTNKKQSHFVARDSLLGVQCEPPLGEGQWVWRASAHFKLIKFNLPFRGRSRRHSTRRWIARIRGQISGFGNGFPGKFTPGGWRGARGATSDTCCDRCVKCDFVAMFWECLMWCSRKLEQIEVMIEQSSDLFYQLKRLILCQFNSILFFCRTYWKLFFVDNVGPNQF